MADDVDDKVVLLHRLGDAVRKRGPSADLDELADEAGVGAEVVRLHFPNGRKALVGEIIQSACEEFDEAVTDPMLSAPTPREALEEAADGLAAYYEGGARHCLFDLFSVPDDAEHIPALKEVTDRFRRALVATFIRLGEPRDTADSRALRVLAELHGTLVLGRLTGDDGLFRAFTDGLPQLARPVSRAG